MNALSPIPTTRTDQNPVSVATLQEVERPITGQIFISPIPGTLVFEGRAFSIIEGRPLSINVHSTLTVLDVQSLSVVSPHSISSEASFGVPSVMATPTRGHRSSRVLFELKVLSTFLREVIAHPRSTSRLVVDSERRTVEVERD